MCTSAPSVTTDASLAERFSAALYEPVLSLGERLGMRRRRADLLAGVSGRVLEIGAGTGLNLEHYPAGVELVLTEPVAGMRDRLAARVAAAGRDAEVVAASADALPFADDAFDVVVSTMVLCTVPDQEAALGEIRRVLRPGGRLVFIEHVRASSRVRAFVQDRLNAPWRVYADGCECNRATVPAIRRHFADTDTRRDVWRGMPGIVHPLVIGSAVA
ncbi:MAG TPA: class I SAM-dependent methyltransferase [Capillimicrobium sp.]|jgi:ubiquinone/menaquinone biosynthesis C-methylase UbiE